MTHLVLFFFIQVNSSVCKFLFSEASLAIFFSHKLFGSFAEQGSSLFCELSQGKGAAPGGSEVAINMYANSLPNEEDPKFSHVLIFFVLCAEMW